MFTEVFFHFLEDGQEYAEAEGVVALSTLLNLPKIKSVIESLKNESMFNQCLDIVLDNFRQLKFLTKFMEGEYLINLDFFSNFEKLFV